VLFAQLPVLYAHEDCGRDAGVPLRRDLKLEPTRAICVRVDGHKSLIMRPNCSSSDSKAVMLCEGCQRPPGLANAVLRLLFPPCSPAAKVIVALVADRRAFHSSVVADIGFLNSGLL